MKYLYTKLKRWYIKTFLLVDPNTPNENLSTNQLIRKWNKMTRKHNRLLLQK